MAATVTELAAEEGAKATDDRREFFIQGADTKADAQAALESSTDSLNNDGLLRQPVHVREVPGVPGGWFGVVTYAPSDYSPYQDGDEAVSFDTTGGTAHIVTSRFGTWDSSYGTATPYAPAGVASAPKTHGLIGITSDGVEGVDIVAPSYRFSITKYISAGKVDATYKGKLRALTGKVNDDQVTLDGVTYEAGEVLFLGATGGRRGRGGDWEITLSFLANENIEDATIAGATGVDKKGHQYVWVMHEEQPDETAKQLTRKALGVYVETVYDEGDFGDLEPEAEE